MARGQPITREELVGVLKKEIAPILRKEIAPILRKEIAPILLEFHENVVKKDIVRIIQDFHEKVDEPMMDKVLDRLDRVEVNLKNEVGRLERKLDKVTDHQADKLDDHEERIGRIEAIV